LRRKNAHWVTRRGGIGETKKNQPQKIVYSDHRPKRRQKKKRRGVGGKKKRP